MLGIEALILYNSLKSYLNMFLLVCRLIRCLRVVASQKMPFSFKENANIICLYIGFLFFYMHVLSCVHVHARTLPTINFHLSIYQ